MKPEDLNMAQLYLDGELDRDRVAAFASLLETDPGLKEYLDQLAEVKDLALEMEVMRAPELRPGSKPAPPMALARLSISSFFAGAAAAAACILLGFGLAGRIQQPPVSVGGESMFRMVYYSPTARSVSVLGDFNGWSGEIPLRSGQGGYWEAEVRVPPGEYRYVFVVDGRQHIPDPTADYVIDDDFGSKNSVVRIGL
ncbi:MAG: hypothetical protein RRA32_00685 [bacterium]|nr:hypothetical protein [bacterium]